MRKRAFIHASLLCFFFNDTATTEIYTLSLHDALPILLQFVDRAVEQGRQAYIVYPVIEESEKTDLKAATTDRKSTRLNSSHANISYAVFCLKKKKHPPARSLLTRTLSCRRSSPHIHSP